MHTNKTKKNGHPLFVFGSQPDRGGGGRGILTPKFKIPCFSKMCVFFFSILFVFCFPLLFVEVSHLPSWCVSLVPALGRSGKAVLSCCRVHILSLLQATPQHVNLNGIKKCVCVLSVCLSVHMRVSLWSPTDEFCHTDRSVDGKKPRKQS